MFVLPRLRLLVRFMPSAQTKVSSPIQAPIDALAFDRRVAVDLPLKAAFVFFKNLQIIYLALVKSRLLRSSALFGDGVGVTLLVNLNRGLDLDWSRLDSTALNTHTPGCSIVAVVHLPVVGTELRVAGSPAT